MHLSISPASRTSTTSTRAREPQIAGRWPIAAILGVAAVGAGIGGVACSNSSGGGAGGGGASTTGSGGNGPMSSRSSTSHLGSTSMGSMSSMMTTSTVSDAGSDAGMKMPANAIYTMTNSASANTVLGFLRAADGTLTPMAAPFSTGGMGSGMGLGSQGAVTLDTMTNRLYGVNAGDGTFSIFPVNQDGTLGTATKVAGATGLLGPKSITAWGDTVYVLYEGDATHPSAIAGYQISGHTAAPIANTTLNLSSATASVDPAQIQFSPDGKWLVVTEKMTNQIDTFAVASNGVATKTGFFPTASAGPDAGVQSVPYGFAFYGNTLIVSEAGVTGVGTYTYANGMIAPVTSGTQFLATGPAPCWVAVASDWAYVANAHGADISGFTVAATGGLTPIGTATNAVVAASGRNLVVDGGTLFEGPTDEAVSADGKYLYAIDPGVPTIGIFAINADGTLSRVGSTDYAGGGTLMAGGVGLAAR